MTAYAGKHQGGSAVARYQRKLDNRIDRLRHGEEVKLLARYAKGAVYDCTIGTGRFIGLLPQVTSYGGMDASAEFVSYVTSANPEVAASVRDLTNGIDEPDGTYDCVICLRSLSGIGHLPTIVPAMVRVTKPGGLIILDYGRRPVEVKLDGHTTVLDGEDLDGVLAHVDASLVERHLCDAVLTRLKRAPRLFRLINGRLGRLLPDAALNAVERIAAPIWWERQILVLRRNDRAVPDLER